MKKIVVIGCGFAGLAVARRLSRARRAITVTLVDKKETFDFLPMLPDRIGRDISPSALRYPIRELSRRYHFDFVNDEVRSVELDKKSVITPGRRVDYDYLVIASGSETNFYGNEEIKNCAYRLDSVEDVQKIFEAAEDAPFDSYIMSGGGYTGIEVATNLRAYFNKRSKKACIIIVEKASSILGPLPDWMKRYALDNLRRLDVEVLTEHAVERVEDKQIFLSGGTKFKNAMLIWVAGVKTHDYVQRLDKEKTKQGRLRVDEYMRIEKQVFVVGDCADFRHKKTSLRMAVQFSLKEAEIAASNIIKDISGRRLARYRPVDLGYIVPMANNRSCGIVLGIHTAGFFATLFHFIMCIYRSCGNKNRFGIIRNLTKGGL